MQPCVSSPLPSRKNVPPTPAASGWGASPGYPWSFVGVSKRHLFLIPGGQGPSGDRAGRSLRLRDRYRTVRGRAGLRESAFASYKLGNPVEMETLRVFGCPSTRVRACALHHTAALDPAPLLLLFISPTLPFPSSPSSRPFPSAPAPRTATPLVAGRTHGIVNYAGAPLPSASLRVAPLRCILLVAPFSPLHHHPEGKKTGLPRRLKPEASSVA